jgi:hypothetical protein
VAYQSAIKLCPFGANRPHLAIDTLSNTFRFGAECEHSQEEEKQRPDESPSRKRPSLFDESTKAIATDEMTPAHWGIDRHLLPSIASIGRGDEPASAFQKLPHGRYISRKSGHLKS